MRINQYFKSLLLGGALLSLSSCASILNSRYQVVKIQTPESGELQIDGKEPETKNGGYVLRRNQQFKQLTFKTEGHKDVNRVITNYLTSPLHYLSWFPFGPTLFIPAADHGSKSQLSKTFLVGNSHV